MRLEERPKSKYVLNDDNDRIVIITSRKNIALQLMKEHEKSSDSDSSEI